jgi:hypothetical protein
LATNSIENPHNIEPQITQAHVDEDAWKHDVGPNTIEVIDMPLK